MLGKKRVSMAGIIVPATYGWNGNTPLKHPLIGGILTPRCNKNGQEMKTRLNFEILINDMSEKGYKIARCVVFGSLQAEPGKSFAERIARQIVPGRYVEIEAEEHTNTVPMSNLDGSAVVQNGQQANRDYYSYVINPGGIRIYNRDSVETQRLMAQHWLKAKTVQANAWDFFWRPLSISFNPATGQIEEMSDADKATLEATNKVRNQLPLVGGMASYGFAKVTMPEGAIPVLQNNAAYDQWIQSYIGAGILGPDGLPVVNAVAAPGPVAGGPAQGGLPNQVAQAVQQQGQVSFNQGVMPQMNGTAGPAQNTGMPDMNAAFGNQGTQTAAAGMGPLI
jgi:hypothetical protein